MTGDVWSSFPPTHVYQDGDIFAYERTGSFATGYNQTSMVNPTIQVSGADLVLGPGGILEGTVDRMVFATDNGGVLAEFDGLSFDAADLSSVLMADITPGDLSAHLRLYEYTAAALGPISFTDAENTHLHDGPLLFASSIDLQGTWNSFQVRNFVTPDLMVSAAPGAYNTLSTRLTEDSDAILDVQNRVIRGNDVELKFQGFTTFYLDEGLARVVGSDAAETFQAWGGTQFILAGGGSDELIGSSGDDVLLGQDGNDTLEGGRGSDLLNGGSGRDTLDGGENSDTYIVDALDTVDDTGSIGYDKAQITDGAGVYLLLSSWSGLERVNGYTGNDTIDASTHSTGFLLFGHDGDDQLLGGSGNDTLIGGLGDDRLEGGAGNDALIGGPGSDVLIGGDGNDVLFIGDGDDTQIDGGAGFDKVVITDAGGLTLSAGTWTGVERINGLTGNDQIDASGMNSAVTLSGAAGDDILVGGSADDRLFGGADDDQLDGANGNDALIGAAGDDTLVGGLGNDFLLGGAGSDRFLWTTDFGRDVVKDFQDGVDRLDFSTHAGVNAIGDLVIAQSGQHTRISLAAGGQDQITLADTLATSITASDFDFV